MNKFWMVLGRGTPTFRHTKFDDAHKEAERLARANPGETFVVLQAMASVVSPLPTVVWEAAQDEIPF